MNRLFYLVQAARQAALAAEAPASNEAAADVVKTLHETILKKEGGDGYLRQARVALGWTERLARLTLSQKPDAPGLTWATLQAATAARALAANEELDYPGVVVNAFLDPKTIRALDPNKELIDAKFALEAAKKPGETFDLELTVWDFYRHPIKGTVSPRLPTGWKAVPESVPFSAEPGQFQCFIFTVTVPTDVKGGVQTVGGRTTYQGREISEIHAQRIRVTP